MRATGWHNSGSPTEPGAYGLRVTKADRDHYFDRAWSEVVVELDGGGEAVMPVSESFWRACSELRSADFGRWLLASGSAPWPKGQPPGLVVTPLDGNRFSARVLERHNLL